MTHPIDAALKAGRIGLDTPRVKPDTEPDVVLKTDDTIEICPVCKKPDCKMLQALTPHHNNGYCSYCGGGTERPCMCDKDVSKDAANHRIGDTLTPKRRPREVRPQGILCGPTPECLADLPNIDATCHLPSGHPGPHHYVDNQVFGMTYRDVKWPDPALQRLNDMMQWVQDEMSRAMAIPIEFLKGLRP